MQPSTELTDKAKEGGEHPSFCLLKIERGGVILEKIRKIRSIAVFLIPAVLIYLCFELIPVVMSVYFSFNDWPGLQAVPLKFVGFKNYSNLFHNAVFLKSLQNVLIYVVVSVICRFYWIWTWITDPSFQKGQRFFKAAFFIPMIYQ